MPSDLVTGQVALVHFYSFRFTASTDKSIPPLQYTGRLRNEGAGALPLAFFEGFVVLDRVLVFGGPD